MTASPKEAATDQPDAHLPDGLPHRSDDLFRIALESAPTGMILVDDSGRIVLVNAHVESLFGYTREALVGQPIEVLVPGRFRDQHPQARARVFTESNPVPRPMGAGRDLYGLRKDGTEVPIEIGLNPLETKEGRFVLGSVVDITERKRAAERIETALREKETLLREVHHRVKNNLQVISSLFSLQSRYLRDPSLADLLQESQNRVHAIALVHEKLHQAQEFGRVDFCEYVSALTRHLATVWAGARAITLRVACESLRLPIDTAVPCGLIVNELISNAYQHAFPDGRSGQIEVRAQRQTGGAVCVSVSDDGVGLAPQETLQGAGRLGLQLVATLARQLDATLTIERQPSAQVAFVFQEPA